MNIKSAEFVTSAVKPSQYPPSGGPEIAFAGRSNVGKSSLINALLGRKNLVKTSSKPGRTQTINFFLINNRFCFTDLPGYGYAKVPMAVRKSWGPMVEKYLRTRPEGESSGLDAGQGLRAVVVILDIRRMPNQGDHDLLAWLTHYRIPALVVLTKADKLKKNKQNQQRGSIARQLSTDPHLLSLFSATTGLGKRELWTAIEGFL
ncbi:MAG: YihA family ribosome biogenesis GTP-binding protein [Desulfobacterales bacterium C00003060]|nr:MAG: YihA family ribosome biogenesis GTP-binding protein [Desulfobacterales bacterium C00003060]OEU82004.1 MAG: YihA family ribosome biogenesis GTP-binding protein [Desulfobacterales bacterium S5133MH4]